MSAAAVMTDRDAEAAPPHPAEVRNFRTCLGAPMESLAKAAGYATKRSWWLVETAKVEMPAWRWQLVQAAANRGELARCERAAGKNRADVQVHVDELLWIDAERRASLVKAVRSLMDHLELSVGDLAARSGLSREMLATILGGSARKQTTTQRMLAIVEVLDELRGQAEEAVRKFNECRRTTPATLRDLRIGLRVPQRTAGSLACPSSVAPGALMSGYECETISMPAEAATRLAAALLLRFEGLMADASWQLLHTVGAARR